MKVLKSLINLVSSKASYLSYEEDNSCPVCKAKISPVFISASLNTQSTGSIFNYCRGCSSTFVTNYNLKISGKTTPTNDYYDVESIINSVPNIFKEETFSDEIIKLSPMFVKIYNQALAAETSSLDEIAGLGYRKALEFLIKDFAISENPKDETDIKKMQLAPCIKQYITDPNVKTLATRTAWLGNDEAHYIRKHDDRDITDMKLFIKASIYFISMIMITKDASSIESK